MTAAEQDDDETNSEPTPTASNSDAREYLRIIPTDTSVTPKTVHSQFLRLHEFAWHRSPAATGVASRLARSLFGDRKRPRSMEWLIVTDGDTETALEYYLGLETPPETASTAGENTRTTRDRPATPHTTAAGHSKTASADLAAFERLVRAMLPNDYDVTRVRWHPTALLGTDDIHDHEAEGATAAEPAYSAVEFVGRASRPEDWQTRLVPLRAWLDETGPDARPPLSGVVETLADSVVPAVYQVLVQPRSSWSAAAATRRTNLLEGRDTRASRWLRDLGLGGDDYGARNREKLERRRSEAADPLGTDGSTPRPSGSPVDRVRAIDVRDTDHTFVVNARVVARHRPCAPASTPDTQQHVDALCADLTSAFSAMAGPYHTIEGRRRTGGDARQVCDALCARTTYEPEYERRTTLLPGVANTSRGIVVDPQEAPALCLLDGGSLTPTAMEALAPTPGERARPHGPPPARDLLSRYRGPGLTLGQFRPGWTTGVDETGLGYHAPPPSADESQAGAADGQPTEVNGRDRTPTSARQSESFVVRLPPPLQRLHVAWFGKTGSGKSTSGSIALLDNHEATDGATILIDQKGDGMATDLLRMKFARDGRGALDDVYYFDAARHLPAFSFFDIREQLAAGVPRAVAVEDVIAHYVEMIIQLKSREWYYDAPLSAKLIEAVLAAMFDPVHGRDAFSHREFRAMLSWMASEQTAPAVSDPDIERILTDAVTAGTREFRNIMNGVFNRVDEVSSNTYLAEVLTHVHPDAPQARESTGDGDQQPATEPERPDSHPSFAFADVLDDDVIVIVDLGGLREAAQRALTVLVVSKLWTALRRRTHRRQQLHGQGRTGGRTHVDDSGGIRGASDDDSQRVRTESTDSTEHIEEASFESVEQIHEMSTERPETVHEPAPDNSRETRERRLDHGPWHEEKTPRGEDGDDDGESVAEVASTDPLEASAADETRSSTAITDDLPLVNLFVEEASNVAASGAVTDLLKQARSFGCSVTLSMQYPAQLKHADPETYSEVLNNVSTIVAGNVPLDRDLAARLATSDMGPQEVANRLRALSRGEWLCALPAGFGEVEPRPFVLESAPLPAGHPEGPRPLAAADQLRFDIAHLQCEARTRREHSLSVAGPTTVGRDRGADAAGIDPTADGDDAEAAPGRRPRVDTALPYTRRLPETVTYLDERHALECTACGNRYDPSPAGMRRAISCCSSLDTVDADDIPICAVNLKLTRDERAATGLSDPQLMLLQVVHNAQQLRYEPPEYDLLRDSMIRLLEYVGATTKDVQELIDAGYLTHDANHPHRLYSVTTEGRSVIGEAYREGVDFGHGKGDLEETSLHMMMVEVGYRFLVQSYQEDPESPVVEVIKYFDLERAAIDRPYGDDERDETSASNVEHTAAAAGAAEEHESVPESRRLDAVGLDAEGNVVVTLEAERINHDLRRAAPADFDKMAACDPEAAIWLCSTQKAGYKILRALNEPLDGMPRVEKEYSSTTPPHQYRIDTPGLTAMYNVEYLRDRLADQ